MDAAYRIDLLFDNAGNAALTQMVMYEYNPHRILYPFPKMKNLIGRYVYLHPKGVLLLPVP